MYRAYLYNIEPTPIHRSMNSSFVLVCQDKNKQKERSYFRNAESLQKTLSKQGKTLDSHKMSFHELQA